MQNNTRHIEVNTAHLVNIEKDYRNHVNRLVNIASSKKYLSSQQKIVDQHDVRSLKSKETHRRKQFKQLSDIQKDNERILGKLIQINSKSVKASPAKKEINMTQTTGSNRFGFEDGKAKSLNYITRKKEIMKVLNENVHISKKICFQESTISKQKFDSEYKKSQEYSQRIRKVKVNRDRTCDLGTGVKLTPSLRVKNNTYLPALPSLALTHCYPILTLRSSSAQKSPYKTWGLSSRSSTITPRKELYKTARIKDVKPLFSSQGALTARDFYSSAPAPIAEADFTGFTVSEKKDESCEMRRDSPSEAQNKIFAFTETVAVGEKKEVHERTPEQKQEQEEEQEREQGQNQNQDQNEEKGESDDKIDSPEQKIEPRLTAPGGVKFDKKTPSLINEVNVEYEESRKESAFDLEKKPENYDSEKAQE